MFGWTGRRPSLPGTALAMVGPRSSDEVLVLGARDPTIAGEIGAVTRLNGRTVVVGQGPAEAALTARAAEQAGGLLEFVDAPLARLPFEPATFHIIVVPDLPAWPADACGERVAEAIRVLRPGGRMVLLVGQPRRTLFGRVGGRPPDGSPALAHDLVLGLLTAAGMLAARRLADTEGVEYYEARKGRESS